MAASSGIQYDGAILSYGDDSTATTNAVTLTEVVSVSSPQMTIGATEFTHLASDNNAREFKAGLVDSGEITFTLNYVEAMTATLYTLAVAGTTKYWKVKFSDLSHWICAGFITALGNPSGGEDERVTLDVTVKLTGLAVFTDADS
jgi:hypothetical protein